MTSFLRMYTFQARTLSLFVILIFTVHFSIAQKPHDIHSLEVRLEADEAIETYQEGNKRIDSSTGYPVSIFAINEPAIGGTPIEMAQDFLTKKYSKLGLQYPDLSDLRHHATRSTNAGNVVRFRQYLAGYPVNKAEVTVSLDPNNVVQLIQNSYQRKAKLTSERVDISESEAIQIAMEYIRPTRMMQSESSHLMVYHNNKMTRLAHEVMIIAGEPQGEWHVFVDAQSGEIFKVQNMLVYYCKKDHHHTATCNHEDKPTPKPTSYYFPGLAEALAIVDGSGMVFDPDPLSSNQVAYGGNYSDNNDATNIDLDNARVSVVLRDIEVLAGVYRLLGPWAEIRDHDAPTTGLFTQNTSVFNFNRQEQGFEAVNCYYHLDDMMRYVNITLGCAAVPFQYTGGVRFDPHGAGGADNSFYSGGAGTLTFGEGCVDDGEDSDVIHHELGHFLHDMVTAGNLSQVNGLSEGVGDYVAQSYNRSLNNWTPTDPAYHWVFNWDGHNPCFGGRVTNNTATYPAGLVGQVHADGSIWSSSLMNIYDAIGRQVTDKVFYEGLGMTNGSTNQNDAANAVYQAAINLNYTTSQIAAIHSEFTARGYTLPALPAPPVASYSANATQICRDITTTINFTDSSTSGPTSWAWTFEGGTPATSTAQNPIVTYNSDGIFDVSLTVSNANGTNSLTDVDFITVVSGASCPNCSVSTNAATMSIGPNANTITTSIINIPTGGIITDVNITNVTGTHTFLGDLTFTLTSPTNTAVILLDGICGSDNDFNIGFDDMGIVGSLPCPYTDGMLYLPNQVLSAFNGEDSAGNWTLEIEDGANQDGGDLTSWSIEVCIEGMASTCEADLVVPNPTTGTYNASNSITSNGNVANPDNVIFQAGNCIELLPGFNVELNAEFLGEIEVCPQQ